MILAYHIDGVEMPMSDIPRIVFVGPAAPITDGHLWDKQVSSIEVTPPVVEYTLHLVGAYTYDMDRQTLESGINCHRTNYTVGTKTYTGIPLWYLCGFVDDPHWAGNHTFRDGFNYTVTVFASDDYNKTLTYQTVARNNTIIVANQLNSTRLTGMDPPLMLVSGLSKSYNIKGVDKIVLNWEPNMELSMSESSVETNESVTITATLTDGVPISGENVSFLVNGVEIGEATTDSAGEATIEYTPTIEGTYTIQGKFVFGTTENVKNSSVSVSAPSSGGGIDLGIAAIVIVIIIAIAAIAAFAFLRKR
jgi:hypothetical protein